MANKLIDDIRNKQYNEDLIKKYMDDLFKNGSVSYSTLEVLSYIKIFDPELFSKYEDSILLKMGLFFKPTSVNNFEDMVFDLFKQSIKDVEKQYFTPIQTDILNKINKNKFFSFSSPTSTGKSHVFRQIIDSVDGDVVIFVPSRALINEYYKSIREIYHDNKSINVLTFVDVINTHNAKRNIFIITPERSKDLFYLKEQFNIEYILFDEAQLGEDKNVRGLYYDSVIRRCVKTFTSSKFIFAYPFIANPGAQFIRNKIDDDKSDFCAYQNKNVGQIFYAFDETGFYHFGIDQKLFGNKVRCNYNPIKKVLDNNGTVLIYCSKSKIYSKSIFVEFKDYILNRKKITDPEALEIIDKFRNIIGAGDNEYGDYRSTMVNFLKRGIVVHHGSLPLSARSVLEEFTKKGYCSLCFATSTLDQGVNMPFDLVFIDRFEPSKPLRVKNLIGRAGRSTNINKFDYGQIVIKSSSITDIRKIIKNDTNINEISELDITVDPNDDYKEYKEAIKNDDLCEEYNLTNKEVKRLQSDESMFFIKNVIDNIFNNDGNIKNIETNFNDSLYMGIIANLKKIYEIYLNRELTDAESYIAITALKIILWKIKGRKFSQVVSYRYAYASRIKDRADINTENISENFKNIRQNSLPANPITEFQMIPNKNLIPRILTYKQRAIEVDYDRVMVDTYDYLDKLIGFRFGDVFFATFDLYYKITNNILAKSMANYIKYGTNVEKEIWMLRYGFEFEDFDWLENKIKDINEQGIVLMENSTLSDEEYEKVKAFII